MRRSDRNFLSAREITSTSTSAGSALSGILQPKHFPSHCTMIMACCDVESMRLEFRVSLTNHRFANKSAIAISPLLLIAAMLLAFAASARAEEYRLPNTAEISGYPPEAQQFYSA